jgi:hypothetical protein
VTDDALDPDSCGGSRAAGHHERSGRSLVAISDASRSCYGPTLDDNDYRF